MKKGLSAKSQVFTYFWEKVNLFLGHWQLITFKVFMIPCLVNLRINFLNKSFQIGHMMPFKKFMTHLSV